LYFEPRRVKKQKVIIGRQLPEDNNYEVVSGSPDDIPYKDNRFKLVHSLWMFDEGLGVELPVSVSREKTASEIFRVLQKGGVYAMNEMDTNQYRQPFLDVGFEQIELYSNGINPHALFIKR